MSTKAMLVQQSPFKFHPQAQISHNQNPVQRVVAVGFYLEITAHPIPRDFEAVNLPHRRGPCWMFFMRLTYCCFAAKGPASMRVFGPFKSESQIWPAQYSSQGGAKLDQSSCTMRFMRLRWPHEPEHALSQSPPEESGHVAAIGRTGTDQGIRNANAAGTKILAA